MQNNPVQNNPTAFWLGLVVTFVVLSLMITAAGAALASFARPRAAISEASR